MPAWIQTMDEGVLRWLESLRIPVLNELMIRYTSLGNGRLLFIAAAILMLIFQKTRRSGVASLGAMGFGLLATNLTIKPLVARARPWVVMEGFETLVRSPDMNSFPSGHTCAAFAFAAAVCSTLPWRWGKAAAIAAAVLMGFSRLYVGVHFPSDVLAGALIGILCGALASWLSRKIKSHR